MFEEAAVAQARVLLVSLYECINEVSQAIAKIEHQIQYRPHRPGLAIYQRRRIDELRRELYEAHRLIDGMHARFPSARREVRTDSKTRGWRVIEFGVVGKFEAAPLDIGRCG